MSKCAMCDDEIGTDWGRMKIIRPEDMKVETYRGLCYQCAWCIVHIIDTKVRREGRRPE